jgi:transposase
VLLGANCSGGPAGTTEVGAQAVIPCSQAIPYDKHLYQERNLVERFINDIKHYRRIATRYEKTALTRPDRPLSILKVSYRIVLHASKVNTKSINQAD